MARKGRRIKILLAINGLGYGGSESVLCDIAPALVERGHAIHVLSLKRLGQLGLALRERGLPVTTLDMRESFTALEGAVVTARLARWLTRQRFDIIHSFLPRANVLSRVANRLSRYPAVHLSSEHSTDFRRLRTVSTLNRLTARWTDLVLAVSPRIRDTLVSRDGLAAERIQVLANPVDLAAIEAAEPTELRRELTLQDDAILACSVGRLVRVKGHSHVIRALASLASQRPRLHLVLVGDGPEEAALHHQVSASGLDGRVHILGFRADVLGILKACDLFVLPSLQEGLPVTLLEAMACECPVIATDVGDIAMLVQDGETGILVPPAELWDGSAVANTHLAEDRSSDQETAGAKQAGAGLAAALDYLAGNAAARAHFSRRARQLVERHYALETIAASIERIYLTLVGRKESAAAAPRL